MSPPENKGVGSRCTSEVLGVGIDQAAIVDGVQREVLRSRHTFQSPKHSSLRNMLWLFRFSLDTVNRRRYRRIKAELDAFILGHLILFTVFRKDGKPPQRGSWASEVVWFCGVNLEADHPRQGGWQGNGPAEGDIRCVDSKGDSALSEKRTV